MTAWASVFLSVGDELCIHEPETIVNFNDIEEIKPYSVGYASSGFLFMDTSGYKPSPGSKIAIIIRERNDSQQSFLNLFQSEGNSAASESFLKGEEKMHDLLNSHKATGFSFNALASGCILEAKALFEFCYGRRYKFSPARTAHLLGMNIQSKVLEVI
jgi:hypothetical protein